MMRVLVHHSRQQRDGAALVCINAVQAFSSIACPGLGCPIAYE